ncbi:11421_t:CDS:2 [Diversispora eburnea]|uniref:11421_t:CDS:1 n=1 Tax=Diversispora eburnea TaxID=1213867 RepID=A0A9N9FD51_9GLOM|nr:11421_t:CDS:2 [Diversispora eburnea]
MSSVRQTETNDVSEILSTHYDYDFEFNTKENEYITDNYMNLKRRRALAEIDNAEFSWFHIRACIVSGVGFYTDAYDLFAINLVSSMLGFVYFKPSGYVPQNIDIGLKISAACGTLFGQLIFGWFADRYGRKKMYGLELSIMIFATIGSALSADAFAVSIWGELMFWRFILGIGIGGDYPLSAGAMMAAVFAMQGFGILTAAIVSLVTLAIYQDHISKDPSYIDHVWRLVLGFGVIPAVIALYFRLKVPETPRFTMDVERNVHQAAYDIKTVHPKRRKHNKRKNHNSLSKPVLVTDAPRATWKNFKEYFGQWKNAKILIGTSVSWFVLDVAFYGIGLNNSIILKAIRFADHDDDPYKTLWNMSVGNIIVTMLGTVPGYWFTVFLVDKWGRKFIQLLGFGILTILFTILGFFYHQILDTSLPLFIIIFTSCQFFLNFGPNATTFIIPGEVFPTRYRSTGHGISAASGKLGAIIAQVGFIQLKDNGGPNQFVNQNMVNNDNIDVDDCGESGSNYVHIRKYKNNRNYLWA